eukprot:Skav236183  [mRNA]  locus=scaffold3111:27257:29282:- [translate_table: standard]
MKFEAAVACQYQKFVVIVKLHRADLWHRDDLLFFGTKICPCLVVKIAECSRQVESPTRRFGGRGQLASRSHPQA